MGDLSKSSYLGGVDSYLGGVFSCGGCTHIRGFVLHFRATVLLSVTFRSSSLDAVKAVTNRKAWAFSKLNSLTARHW